ncbi:regulator of chromosome condensation 1/beta-lactamase-inhibitor protein II [Lipomyces kononenkoae]
MPSAWLYAIGLDIFSQLTGSSKHNNWDYTLDRAEKNGKKKRRIVGDGSSILARPRCIAQGEYEAEVLWVGWSGTLLRIDGSVELRGFSAYETDDIKSLELTDGVGVVGGFGWADLLGIVDSCGHIWRCNPGSTTASILQIDSQLSAAFENTVKSVAITGTEQVAVLHDHGASITTFSSLLEFYAYPETKNNLTNARSRKHFRHHQQITYIRAGEAHFVALDLGGQVYTWGANLHGELLQPLVGSILRPLAVPALEGTPMRDVATNGFLTACLSQDTKDVYIWGWTPSTRIIGLPNAGDDVAGIIDQFDENEHLVIEHLAVGNGFVVLASSDSQTGELCVWVAGGSDWMNMLGLPRSETFVKVNGEWSGKRRDQYELSVFCGSASIFVRLDQK